MGARLVKSKVLADCMEALIGAWLMAGGRPSWLTQSNNCTMLQRHCC